MGYAVAFLAVAGFCSATHDIAADGTYIAALSSKEQAAFAGWQSGFYSAARFFSQGVLIWLAGFLTARFMLANFAEPAAHAWMAVFGLAGAILVLLGLYHARILPKCGEERESQGLRQSALTFWDVVTSFFKKKNIYVLLLFILLYRAGEGQSAKVCPLFLSAARGVGGLGLDNERLGILLGVGGMFTILGSVLAGYFTSAVGLRRALPWLVAVLCSPMFLYWYLSVAQPTNLALIGTAVSAEMFGYGFGFVGLILLMMQEIAPGRYQTAHYSFATSLMQIAFILPGTVSGRIAAALGFSRFFPWVILATLPALILSRFLPIGEGAQTPESLIAEPQG
jgi:PAT family beta-lactamase induction signal transducer AmpG